MNYHYHVVFDDLTERDLSEAEFQFELSQHHVKNVWRIIDNQLS